MDAVKVGNFIRELRKKNGLTQKLFGEKYNVSYQAVSKWERGINMPDIELLRQISKDFDVSIEDILDGEVKEKPKKKVEAKTVKIKESKKDTKKISEVKEKKKEKEKIERLIYPYIIGGVALIFIGLLVALLFVNTKPADTFIFKTISSTCEEFKVTGAIAYDSKKSSINISNIDYCGGDDDNIYDEITCELYEEEGNTKTLISKCNKEGKEQKLEEFLEEIEINVDNYEQQCKSYQHNKIYLEIKASKDKKTTMYQVDLNLKNNCGMELGDKND